MVSKKEKIRRAKLVEDMIAEDEKKSIKKMPISLINLGKLFDYLEEKLEQGCDHTTRNATNFLNHNSFNTEEVLLWLQSYGGFCDCEILANVEDSWESKIKEKS